MLKNKLSAEKLSKNKTKYVATITEQCKSKTVLCLVDRA
jgi:hypothetical protein